MPKRTDIKSILILGAGPIVIGQACEFDYSGAHPSLATTINRFFGEESNAKTYRHKKYPDSGRGPDCYRSGV